MTMQWKRMTTLLLTILLLLAGCDSATEPERPLRVIFIGNSLTTWHDMPAMVRAMSEAAGRGRPLEVRSTAWSGMSLRDHWNDSGTRQALEREGPWDVVLLQESALVSEEGKAYLREHVRLFRGETGGRVALMMPWPPRPARQYSDDVHRAFRQVAAETGAEFVPAGEVWREAALRDPALDLYDPDGGHPNALGTYAAALAVFQALTGESPVGLPSTLKLHTRAEVRLDPAVAALLQESAAAARSVVR
jgi:hypothetical protein